MQTRPLGRSGLQVPPLIFGGNVFGWTADEATSFRLLDTLVDLGLNAIDTADAYSTWVPGHQGGESETVIGAWLKARGGRDRIVLATKFGLPMRQGARLNLDPAYMKEAVEASLRRLNTDHIDLYQAHRDDKVTPHAAVLGGFAELIAEGKVRAIGASNYTGARLAEALETSRTHGLPRYESIQPQYNLVDRGEYEGDVEPVALAEGLGVIPYYGLAAGFLTGKYRSEADLAGKARGGSAGRYMNARGLKALAALDEVAAAHGATPAQAALAWLMARPGVTAPLASATSMEQLQDIARSAALQLTAEDVQRLDEAGA